MPDHVNGRRPTAMFAVIRSRRYEILRVAAAACFAGALILCSPLDPSLEARWHWPWSGLLAGLTYVVGLLCAAKGRYRGTHRKQELPARTKPVHAFLDLALEGTIYVLAAAGLLLVLGTIGRLVGIALFGYSA